MFSGSPRRRGTREGGWGRIRRCLLRAPAVLPGKTLRKWASVARGQKLAGDIFCRSNHGTQRLGSHIQYSRHMLGLSRLEHCHPQLRQILSREKSMRPPQKKARGRGGSTRFMNAIWGGDAESVSGRISLLPPCSAIVKAGGGKELPLTSHEVKFLQATTAGQHPAPSSTTHPHTPCDDSSSGGLIRHYGTIYSK